MPRLAEVKTPREPELGRIFYSQGPARVLQQLARYLASATQCGKLSCFEPELAARLFLGSVVANYQLLGLVLPDEEAFSDPSIRAHVNEAVNMFLARYGKQS